MVLQEKISSNSYKKMGTVSLQRGSCVEELSCFVYENKLHLINSQNEECKVSLYIPSNMNYLILKNDNNGIRVIRINIGEEIYDEDGNLIIINKEGIIICENVYGFKFMNNDTILSILSPILNNTSDNYNDFIYPIPKDNIKYGVVISKGKLTTVCCVGKYYDYYIYDQDGVRLLFSDGEFIPVLGDILIWKGNFEDNMVTIFDNEIKIYKPVSNTLMSHNRSMNAKLSKDSLLLCNDSFLIFHDNKYIFVIDRLGQIYWEGKTLFKPQGIHEDVLWQDINETLKRDLFYGQIVIYDVCGRELLNEKTSGRMKDNKIEIEGSHRDFFVYKIQGLKKSFFSEDNLNMGIIQLSERRKILPPIYDNIEKVVFYRLNIEEGLYDSSKETTMFVCKINNGRYGNIVGLFDGKNYCLPMGKVDDIVSVNCNHKWSYGRYVKNEYGIDSYIKNGGTRIIPTGWFLVIKDNKMALYYGNHFVLDFSIFEVESIDNCPLCLLIKIGNYYGIISPNGWILCPTYTKIKRIRWREDEVEAWDLQESHYFLVDNDIFYFRIKRREFVTKILFSSEGKYKFYRETSASNGTNLQYIRLEDSKIMELNIPYACEELKETYYYYNK